MFENRPNNPMRATEPTDPVIEPRPTLGEIRDKAFDEEKNIEFFQRRDLYEFVPADDPLMQAAREFALENSSDANQATGSVIVSDGEIIGRGANYSEYHAHNGCERKKPGYIAPASGDGYEDCPGCHSRNHSEPQAVANAEDQGFKTEGAELRLWGHWWCCRDCWRAMLEAGIEKVYLCEGSEVTFNRDNPQNTIKEENQNSQAKLRLSQA